MNTRLTWLTWLTFAFTLSSCQTVVTRNRCSAPKEYADQPVPTIIRNASRIVDTPEKKAVVFGLYGSIPRYVDGTFRNVKLVKKLYPSWDPVVYIDPTTVPPGTVEKLRELGAVVRESSDYKRAAARFYIVDDPDYERFVVRDVDSRINWREIAAVADWMKTDFPLHNMHDWPSHKNPLMGGMWGGKSAKIREALAGKTVAELYTDYVSKKDKSEKYGIDEQFLKDVILAKMGGVDKLFIHESFSCDEFPHARGFPIPLGPGLDAIGAQYGK